MPSFQKLLKAQQISKNDLKKLFHQADIYKIKLENNQSITDLQGKILASLFFEPSTRTRLSFETAMHRLGGNVITVENGGSSSTKKGETLADTGKVLDQYVDVVVMRHPQPYSVEEFSTHVNSPVINAGDGENEHPTQSLVDLYTIYSELGDIKNLKIGLLGDLKYGRTVHSLVKILSTYNCSFEFMSSDELKVPDEIKVIITANGCSFNEHSGVDADIIQDCDVLYITRVQQERFTNEESYLKNKDHCYLAKEHILNPEKLIILHPLPRVYEMDKAIDDLPCAKYFEQVRYSVPIRMALLALLVNN